MRAALCDSLDYIASALVRELDLPAGDVREAIDAIGSHRVEPGVFGRYYKLVLAVEAGRFDTARALFLDIIAKSPASPRFRVDLFSEGSLGADKQLYGGLLDLDTGAPPWFSPPAPDPDFQQRVVDALNLIDVADPALARELRGLVIQVVGAAPSSDPQARSFGSVSSFMLWGLLILNLERYRTAADLIQGLVHEAAHLLLFAHSIDGPLVTNAIEERYVSPLRPDPRPMDGVFHATFVSARMHYVNHKLRDAVTAGFEPIAVPELDRRLAEIRGLYFGGLQTVQDHAKLTPPGRRILEETLDYMNSV